MFCFLSQSLFSQIDYYENPGKYQNSKDSTNFVKQLNYGGDFNIWFGYNSYMNISLVVAKPLTKWNSIGAGLDLMWYKTVGYSSQFIYGAGIFDEFFLFNFITLHAEAKLFNVIDYYTYERIWNPAYYIGGGIRQNLGKKSYMTYLILWDFNRNEYSLFNNPMLRFTIYF